MLKKYVTSLAIAALTLSAGAIANAQTVSKTITLPNPPQQIAVDPITNLVYVAVPNFGAKPYDYLVVIDGTKDKIVGTYEIPPYAFAIAVDPVTQKVFLAGTSTDANGVTQNKVVEWCMNTKSVLRVVPVSTTRGIGLVGIAADPVYHNTYVSNASDIEIDVLYNAGSIVNKRIPLSYYPYGVAVNPYLGKVYAALLNGDVAVINPTTKTVTLTTTVPSLPNLAPPLNTEIVADIFSGKVYTANSTLTNSSSVAVLNGNGGFLSNIGVGNTPLGLDVDPFTGLLFVANSASGTVDAISTATNTIIKQLPVSGEFLAVNSVSQKVYVGAGDGTSTLTVITEQ